MSNNRATIACCIPKITWIACIIILWQAIDVIITICVHKELFDSWLRTKKLNGWRPQQFNWIVTDVLTSNMPLKTPMAPLLTWFNFDKIITAWMSNCMHKKVWYEISYPFPFLNFNDCMVQRLQGMDKQFHPTLYNGCNYLSNLGLKLIHVSKRGRRGRFHKQIASRPSYILNGKTVFVLNQDPKYVSYYLDTNYSPYTCSRYIMVNHPANTFNGHPIARQ